MDRRYYIYTSEGGRDEGWEMEWMRDWRKMN